MRISYATPVALALGVLAAGCGAPSDGSTEGEPTGRVDLALTAVTKSQSTYRLNNGAVELFDNSGNRVATLKPDPNTPVISAKVKPGTYYAALVPGWVLQRQVESSWVDVVGVVTSQPLGDFKIHPDTVTELHYEFATGFRTGVVTDTSPDQSDIPAVPGETGTALVTIEVDDCGLYVGKISALASFTVACLGKLDNTLYSVSGGALVRNFSSCTAGDSSNLDSIDGILSLQYDRPELEAKYPKAARDVKANKAYASACISDKWNEWASAFDPVQVNVCPNWQFVSEQNPPETGTAIVAPSLPPVQRDKKGKFDYVASTPPNLVAMQKSLLTYQVSFPTGSPAPNCGTAAQCAEACAAGFEGFVLSTNGTDQVVVDPPYWEDPDKYTAPANPYLKTGYYHTMADYGSPPGDQFGHWQRSRAVQDRTGKWYGEACTYLLGGIIYSTKLIYSGTTRGAVSWCTPNP